MTISYTALLGLAQPVTGTETGQWGTVVNDEITALLEDAVANAASISVTAGNVTLSTTNGSSNQARMSTLIITGTPGTTRNVVAPSQAKIYVVINQSDGAVVIKGAATSGVTIGAGQTAQVAWNGSDFVEIGNYVHGNFVVNGNLSVNGDSTLGNAGADTTTINGQVIAANSNISKATTLSASAPALAWIKGATYTDTGTAGGTTQALAPFTVFSTPTLSTSNIVTYTDAATVYIAGAPAAAGSATITNPYSLYVAAGNAYFGASVSATTLDLTNLEVTNIKAKDGTASMTLADSTGVVTFSKATVIEATDNTNAALRITQLGTGNALLVEDSANPDSSPFVVTATGDVGIGTTSPAQTLHVKTSTAATPITLGVLSNSTTLPALSFNGAYASTTMAGTYSLTGSLYTTVPSGAAQYFSIADVIKMILDSSGNLGLGVTPSAWSSSFYKAIEGGDANSQGAIAFNLSGTSNGVDLWSNGYFDGTNSIYKYSATAGLYQVAGNVHRWYTAPSGTADGTAATSLTSAQNGNSYTIKVAGTTDFTLIGAANNNVGTVFTKSGGTGAGTGTVSQNISFTQAMTLDASGNLLVGLTSSNLAAGRGLMINAPAGQETRLKMTNADSGTTSFEGFDLVLGTSGDVNLIGWEAQPMTFYTAGTIKARIDSNGTFRVKGAGTAGSTDAVQFSGSAPASTLILDSSGNLGVGTSSPATLLDLRTSNGVSAILRLGSSGSVTNTTVGTIEFYDADADDAGIKASISNVITGNVGPGGSQGGNLLFSTATSGATPTERARITSGGNLLVGTQSSIGNGGIFQAKNSGNGSAGYFESLNNGGGSQNIVDIASVTNAAFQAIRFWVDGYATTLVGSIACTTSSTAYNTSSDYRLKNTIAPMTGALAKVALLKPVTYKWNADNSDGEGFIAHELAEVCPSAVSGEKDAVNEDGSIKPQGIDTSFLVATLTAAIQEQQAMINELKAEVAALKGA